MASDNFTINREIVADKTMNEIISTLRALSYCEIWKIKKDFININKKIKDIKKIILKTNIFDKNLGNKNLNGEVYFNKY
jgi:hypothetical protein